MRNYRPLLINIDDMQEFASKKASDMLGLRLRVDMLEKELSQARAMLAQTDRPTEKMRKDLAPALISLTALRHSLTDWLLRGADRFAAIQMDIMLMLISYCLSHIAQPSDARVQGILSRTRYHDLHTHHVILYIS